MIKIKFKDLVNLVKVHEGTDESVICINESTKELTIETPVVKIESHVVSLKDISIPSDIEPHQQEKVQENKKIRDNECLVGDLIVPKIILEALSKRDISEARTLLERLVDMVKRAAQGTNRRDQFGLPFGLNGDGFLKNPVRKALVSYGAAHKLFDSTVRYAGFNWADKVIGEFMKRNNDITNVLTTV